MSWFESDAIAMYPSQGRDDYYNRKARYVSEANVTVSASALTSKHGFVINGLVPSKVDVGSQLSAGSFWIRGYVFTVTSDISITEKGSNAGDVLCAVLRTDENGLRVGIADRIINQNDSTYELDAKDGSAFYGIQIVKKTQAEWDGLKPQHEECKYKSVSVTSGNYTEFYLRLAIWDGSAWKQPKNDNNDTVALNGLKIDASAISVTMAETQSGAAAQEDYTATQDLATFLNKNFIIDDGVTGENGHIRVRELTTSDLDTVLVNRQPAIVRKSDVPYLFVGDGENALKVMQPITARTVEGWIDDANELTADTTTHYKISGVNTETEKGLKIACGDLYALFAGDTVSINGKLSVSDTTTLTKELKANGGITASDLTVKGKTETDSLSVTGTGGLSVTTGTTTLTKELKANGGITASDLTVKGKTETDSLSVTGTGGLSVKGTTILEKLLTAKGGISASGDITADGNISSKGNVTGKIGTITDVEAWSVIASTDTIATGFAKTNYAITDLRTRMESAEEKIENLGSQPITKKSDFGGTGEAVDSIDDLVNVLDDIFRGNETVLGMIKSKNGFYATGGV